MKYNKTLKLATLIFFFLFIYIVPVYTLLTEDKKISEIENKILTQLPTLNFTTIKNKTFMNNFDKYSEDQFPLRENFVNLKNYYNYSIGNREFRDIYVSNDNRLLEKFTHNKEILDKNVMSILNMSIDLYNKHNIDSTLMVVPTSIAFYEDTLPSFATTDNQEYTLNYINEKITSITAYNNSQKSFGHVINFYNPYDVLNKNKDLEIYFDTDHHWTQLGAYLVYNDMIVNTSYDINKNYEKVSDDFYGTYYSKVLLPQVKPDSIYAYKDFNNFKISMDFDKEYNTLYGEDKLNSKNKYQYFLHGDPAFAIIEGNQDLDDEILVFKDSYAHNFIPFLTNNYKRIHVVDPRYYTLDIDTYLNLNENKNINNILFIHNIQTINKEDIYK